MNGNKKNAKGLNTKIKEKKQTMVEEKQMKLAEGNEEIKNRKKSKKCTKIVEQNKRKMEKNELEKCKIRQ